MAKRFGPKLKVIKFGLENGYTVSVAIVGSGDTTYPISGINEHGHAVIPMTDNNSCPIAESEIGSVTLA